MAASAPSFSSCDVVPQQCYRRTAEESPAVSAPSPHLQPTELHLTDKDGQTTAAVVDIQMQQQTWPPNRICARLLFIHQQTNAATLIYRSFIAFGLSFV